MKHYKELLLKKLSENGWELQEIDDDTPWWLESSWKIKSVHQNYGYQIYILFLVDRGYEGHNKEIAISQIGAYTKVPGSYSLAEDIATMPMWRGKFDSKLRVFVNEIGIHRNMQ